MAAVADAAVPPPGGMTRAWLARRVGRGDAPGWSPSVQSDAGEEIFSRTGAPTTMCWGSAQEVVAELGADRAVSSGYFCRPDSRCAMADHAEGHDLAIVDGRFLVDGWLAHVAGAGPCILDLADPRDLAQAAAIHEPFASWTVRPGILAGRAPEGSTPGHDVPVHPAPPTMKDAA
jgi:hypothetical protein